jgi:hypothetical protein
MEKKYRKGTRQDTSPKDTPPVTALLL